MRQARSLAGKVLISLVAIGTLSMMATTVAGAAGGSSTVHSGQHSGVTHFKCARASRFVNWVPAQQARYEKRLGRAEARLTKAEGHHNKRMIGRFQKNIARLEQHESKFLASPMVKHHEARVAAVMAKCGGTTVK
ncbi:MAG: hypothetical protein ACYCVN_10935 [Acidimicrobiales bacterium]